MPTPPHPVNPARPRPLPAPRPKPPTAPRPSRLPIPALLAFATVSLSAGLAIMVTPLGRTAELWAMPTGYAADLLLVPLFIVFTFVSLLSGRPGKFRPLLRWLRSKTPDRLAPPLPRCDAPCVDPLWARVEQPVGS